MRAILITPSDGDVAGLASLELENIEPPQLLPDQIQIAVRAGSVNRADLLTPAGAHSPTTAAHS